MKWQDTSPAWQPAPMERLRLRLAQHWPALLLQRDCVDQLFVATAQANGAAHVAGGPSLLIELAAARTVMAHLGDNHHEQGGLLLGYAYGAPTGATRAVVISEALTSVDFSSSEVSLRMASGLWDQARERLQDPRTPGLLVVGWYHSHPNLGVFFSGTDRRTQAAFFAHPYSVGWVIDPIRGEHACFLGKASEPVGAAQIWWQA